ncbi:MAG: hypothetical protein ACD_62C00339G0006 [uncultured bacterium]|nr:MAG: hypothetical protein ACD_62C00339G0006 [uncultured bacterium]
MKITQILPQQQALALAGDVSLTVATPLLEDVAVGDYVIVHAGFAIEKLSEEAAEETKRLLRELAESNLVRS